MGGVNVIEFIIVSVTMSLLMNKIFTYKRKNSPKKNN